MLDSFIQNTIHIFLKHVTLPGCLPKLCCISLYEDVSLLGICASIFCKWCIFEYQVCFAWPVNPEQATQINSTGTVCPHVLQHVHCLMLHWERGMTYGR